MPITITSAAIVGAQARKVEVQVDLALGLPGWFIVGLHEGASLEARTRVQTAVRNSGYELPHKKVTINLAPGDLRKEGAAFDLPIAIGVLAGAQLIPTPDREPPLVVGELSLSGELMPVRGVLPIALEAARQGIRTLIVPAANAEEGALVEGLHVYGAATLAEAAELWSGQRFCDPTSVPPPAPRSEYGIDMNDVRGQMFCKRAILIAAAGGHNLLLIGPPGAGKTMLARRLPTLLPALSFEESVETTSLWSIAGRLRTNGLMTERPFRAPHHTISIGGLIGAGSPPRPGEISLAHNGVLYLDEICEFGRGALEALRQPLEDGDVTVVRATGAAHLPARFMLAGSMNPCPCGYEFTPERCSCTVGQKQRYRARISGPILDRIDLHIEAEPVKPEEMLQKPAGETSAQLRALVEAAREVQRKRNGGATCNAQLRGRLLREVCGATEKARGTLAGFMHSKNLTARAHDRVLRVARTIADLDGSPAVHEVHIQDAVQLRFLDRPIWGRDPQPPTPTQLARESVVKPAMEAAQQGGEA